MIKSSLQVLAETILKRRSEAMEELKVVRLFETTIQEAAKEEKTFAY